MIEVCSCSASMEIKDVGQWSTEVLFEAFAAWRESHRHEFAPVEPMPDEPPLVVESGSSHERLADEYPTQDRALIGFQRNSA